VDRFCSASATEHGELVLRLLLILFPEDPGCVEAVGVFKEIERMLAHVRIIAIPQIGDAGETEPDLILGARLGDHRWLVGEGAKVGQGQLAIVDEVHRHHFVHLIGEEALHHRIVVGGEAIDGDGIGIRFAIGGIPGADEGFDPLHLLCSGEIIGPRCLRQSRAGDEGAAKKQDAKQKKHTTGIC